MTIKDIAKESGYAVATVSRVLNNRPDVSPEARAKIQAVLDAHNFTPNNNARHLKQPVSDNIVIMINRTVKGMFNLLFSAILEELQSDLEEAGYSSVFYYLHEGANEVEEAERMCRERKPLGLVFIGGSNSNFQKGFSEIKIPSVFVTKSAEGFENLSSVYADNIAGGELAMSWLIENGHTHIGILGGDRVTSSTARRRYNGAMNACAKAGIIFDDKKQYISAQHSYTSGYHAMLKLLESDPGVTAVFAMSDVMAIGAMRALADKGLKVPEDISIVGYDGNEAAAYTCPRLTTIRQDAVKLAQRSSEILVGMLEDGDASVTEIVPVELVPGETVCKPKK